jgi:hypothetical protein
MCHHTGDGGPQAPPSKGLPVNYFSENVIWRLKDWLMRIQFQMSSYEFRIFCFWRLLPSGRFQRNIRAGQNFINSNYVRVQGSYADGPIKRSRNWKVITFQNREHPKHHYYQLSIEGL